MEAGRFDGGGGGDEDRDRKEEVRRMLSVPDVGVVGEGDDGDGEDEDEEEEGVDPKMKSLNQSDLNLLGDMSTSPEEFDRYCASLSSRRERGDELPLFSTLDTVPPFMRHVVLPPPSSSKSDGPRVKERVVYDDGLSEAQFLRGVERAEDEREEEERKRKEERKKGKRRTSRSTTPEPKKEEGGKKSRRTSRSTTPEPLAEGGGKRRKKG